jgi:hypothetical protein
MVGAAVPAFAQDRTTLKWKSVKDWPFYQEWSSETTQTMKVAGSEIKNVQKQTFYFKWTPIAQDNQGNWVLKQKIERVKINIEISGSPPVTYDSDKPGRGSSPLDRFYDLFVGSEFNVMISKDMKVYKIEGQEELIKKLKDDSPEVERLLNQILSEDALKEMADPAFAAIPTKEIKVGDAWERRSKVDMGPIGKYAITHKYAYQGKDKDKPTLDRINVDMNIKYEEPDDTTFAGGLPFKIKTAVLTLKNATGYILFDNEKGRVESSKSTLDLTGNLEIEIGGQTTMVALTQSQRTSIKTTGPVPPTVAEVVESSPPPVCVYHHPSPCRHHRLFGRFRRCR